MHISAEAPDAIKKQKNRSKNFLGMGIVCECFHFAPFAGEMHRYKPASETTPLINEDMSSAERPARMGAQRIEKVMCLRSALLALEAVGSSPLHCAALPLRLAFLADPEKR